LTAIRLFGYARSAGGRIRTSNGTDSNSVVFTSFTTPAGLRGTVPTTTPRRAKSSPMAAALHGLLSEKGVITPLVVFPAPLGASCIYFRSDQFPSTQDGTTMRVGGDAPAGNGANSV
jgi:hypothetical protein